MDSSYLPAGYKPLLDIRQTQVAIKKVKDFFERDLAIQLNLTRVSAPLFVRSDSGLNDTLNGVERPVAFDIKDMDSDVEIVQSLAKWKRRALKDYGFKPGEGLYADMNAIRRDEDTDNLHSVFVDQWDWEKIITPEQRNVDTLKRTVRAIYRSLRHTETYIAEEYDFVGKFLPDEISFITTQELEDMYPDLTPKQRETEIARDKGAVFIMQIGGKLRSGDIHDGRAPDYDDWSLNGDIVVYYPLLDMAYELSSMGIRVNAESLASQLEERGCPERAELPFQRDLLNGNLPLTMGGGIGQSRMCMFFLRKAHIGEVQASIWPQETVDAFREQGVCLLEKNMICHKIKKPSCKTQLGFCYIKLQLRQTQTNLYLPEHSGKSAGGTHCYICAVGTCDGYLHFIIPALIRKIVRVYLGFVFHAVF